VDVAADEDADGGSEDIECGAGDGDQAIGARIGVVAGGFNLQAWGGQLKIPSDTVQDIGV